MGSPPAGQVFLTLLVMRFWRWLIALMLIGLVLENGAGLLALLWILVLVGCTVYVIHRSSEAQRQQAEADRERAAWLKIGETTAAKDKRLRQSPPSEGIQWLTDTLEKKSNPSDAAQWDWDQEGS